MCQNSCIYLVHLKLNTNCLHKKTRTQRTFQFLFSFKTCKKNNNTILDASVSKTQGRICSAPTCMHVVVKNYIILMLIFKSKSAGYKIIVHDVCACERGRSAPRTLSTVFERPRILLVKDNATPLGTLGTDRPAQYISTNLDTAGH